VTAPILPVAVLEGLAECLHRCYRSAQVAEALGLPGQAALGRGDLGGVERLTRDGSPTETMIRLFLLGQAESRTAVAAALAPVTIEAALSCGLLHEPDGRLRAALDLRPYSEEGGPDWWVLSDLGAEVRSGPLEAEHVLGIGQAATTLAQATLRDPVGRALDVGTGSGVQALHLARHSQEVVATDISARALRFAAANAVLNGQRWQLRPGSLLEPVAGEQFDLVVCNPPFIVGPGFSAGAGGFTYRDSGFASDAVCHRLVSGLPAVLAPGGTAQLLANWAIAADGDWAARVGSWLPEWGVTAWIWQREVAEPAEYVALWLRDAGLSPDGSDWQQRYHQWLDWFATEAVAAVGMGLITIRRTDAPSRIVAQDVPQPYQQPIGPAISDWLRRQQWLTGMELEQARLRPAANLVLTTDSLLAGEDGWQPRLSRLRQSEGLRWELEVDDAVAGLVAACSAAVPVGVLFDVLADLRQLDRDEVRRALRPVVHDLIERGFLVPAEATDPAAAGRR